MPDPEDGAGHARPTSASSYEAVRFTTDDGVTLSGWLIPAARETATAVIVHARLLRATAFPSWRPSCRGSSERHHVLQFDFRGHGESDPGS